MWRGKNSVEYLPLSILGVLVIVLVLSMLFWGHSNFKDKGGKE